MTFRVWARVIIVLLPALIIAVRYRTLLSHAGKDDLKAWEPLFDLTALVFICSILAIHWLFTRRITALFGDHLLCVLVWIALYYGPLTIGMPLLRKRYRARTCALLWLLPHAFAHYILTLSYAGSMLPEQPLLVIPLRFFGTGTAMWVWLGGAVLVLAYQWTGHFRYRRILLKDARHAAGHALNIWKQIQQDLADEHEADPPKPLPLYVSPVVHTPVSIGLLRRTTCVVLPDREYSRVELSMIFRHELIHITRRDTETKMFIGLVKAVLWFFPPIWLSARRCAEDIELCCDEYAIAGMEEEERARYAELLLETAGDERGFSSCLAASLPSLRYRLANIVKPKKRSKGILFVAAVMAMLMLLIGRVTVGYAPQTLRQAAGGYDPSTVNAEKIWDFHEDGTRTEYIPQPAVVWRDTAVAEMMEGIPAEDVWAAIAKCEVLHVAGRYDEPENADAVLTLPVDRSYYRISIKGGYSFVTGPFSAGDDVLYMFTDLPGWEEIRETAMREEQST